MRKVITILVLLIAFGTLTAQEIIVKNARGKVEARSGVSEGWTSVEAGQVLESDNTIKTGKNSSARLIADGKTILIPELTLLEVSDLRDISQEELLLKLAMADIRAVPTQEIPGDIVIPKTTIVHGRRIGSESSPAKNGKDYREMELKGATVLYNYALYPSCVLRGKEILLFNPELKSRFDFRMMIATALEKSKLRGEALNEYIAISSENLSQAARAKVEENIRRLKQQ